MVNSYLLISAFVLLLLAVFSVGFGAPAAVKYTLFAAAVSGGTTLLVRIIRGNI